jgi:hypothetical protein
MSPLDDEMEKDAPSTRVTDPPATFLTLGSPANVQGWFTPTQSWPPRQAAPGTLMAAESVMPAEAAR